MNRKFVFGLIATSLLAACGGNGEHYDLSASEVKAKLMAVRPPMSAVGASGVTTMASEVGQDQVRWTMLQGGTPAASFLATITPDGDKASYVSLVLEPSSNSAGGKFAKAMADHPEVTKLLQAAMVEQVDSKLDGREFDYMAIRQETMAAAGAVTADDMRASIERTRDPAQDQRFREMDEARAQARAEAGAND